MAVLLFTLIFCTFAQSPFPQITGCKWSIAGAGISGLYSAWRLINSSTVQANKVCIFEKENRVGGRIYSQRNEFPMRSSVDIGAHRFDPNNHRLVNFIVNDLLNLNTICYSRTNKCNDNGKDYYYLRDYHVKNLKKSSNLPYNFRPDEQWGGTSNQTDPIDPFMELLSMYPFILDAMDNLTSTDDAIYYPTFKRVMTQLKYTKINGKYPTQMDVRTALNHSSEFWQYFLDVEGETNYLIETNIYDTIKGEIFNNREGYRIIANENGDEIGYSTMPEKLAEKLITLGARIFYQHQLVSVYASNGKPVLTVQKVSAPEQTYTIYSDKLMLNMPITSVQSISRDSVIFTNATTAALTAYNLFVPAAAGKVYAYYERAWWRQDLNITKGFMGTTNDLRYYELSDNVVECNGTDCRGFIQFMYTSEQFINFFKTPQRNRYSPKVVINSNDSFLLELHRLFVDSLSDLIIAAGLDPASIAPPTKIIEGLWEPGWHFIPTSDLLGGEPSAAILKPVSSMGIYIVNEGYGHSSGWAESGLVMAEQAMRLEGLTRPGFLLNDYWYDAYVASGL